MKQLVAALPILVAACGSSPAPEPTAPAATVVSPSTAPDACSELAGTCHAPDKNGGGIVHECHRLGHAHDAQACAARRDECMKACTAPTP